MRIVPWRVEDIGSKVSGWLIVKANDFEQFFLAPDKSIDITDIAQLCVGGINGELQVTEELHLVAT